VKDPFVKMQLKQLVLHLTWA